MRRKLAADYSYPRNSIRPRKPVKNPLALSAAAGSVYIADEHANLVHIFTTDGAHVRTIGASGLQRHSIGPNSALVPLPGGDMLVVDTWNYRIHRLDKDHNMLMSWGAAGEFGFDAPA